MANFDYLYNPDLAKKKYVDRSFFVDEKLSFQVIEHGTILPYIKKISDQPYNFWGYGGIVDGNGNYVESSFVHTGIGKPYPPESVFQSSETVIYLGMFHNTWGHVITDNIRRLWFLETEAFRREFKDCSLVYLLCTRRVNFTLESYKNFGRLLEILGIDVDKIRLIDRPTRFEKIILPDESFVIDNNMKHVKFNNTYRETIDRVKNFALKNRTPVSNKKIYYLYNRHSLGEEHMAEYFKSKGYEIVRPENLSLEEQLNLLINCDSFASTLGSISHNSIFLRNGTEAVFIPRAAYAFKYYQQILDEVCPMNTTYIDSSLSLFSNGQGSGLNCFIISPQLKRFFGEKFDGYGEDDFKIFLNYVKDSMTDGRIIHSRIKNYYTDILSDFLAQLNRHEDLIEAYNLPSDWETFRPLLKYQTHVRKKSWGLWNSENQISNPLDKKLDIQAIKVNFPEHRVFYSVYYNNEEGWSEEVAAPEIAGTTGKGKSIYGIRVRLDETGTMAFDILYRVHKFDGTWTPWAKNGETLYSNGQKLNAVQIKLEPKTDETRA